MSWTIPASAVQQPDEELSRPSGSSDTRTVAYKGPFADLETAAKSLASGDEIIPGYVYDSCNLRRAPADLGVLTIYCIPESAADGGGSGGGQQEPQPLKDLWSARTVRNDVSVMAYCGTGDNMPKRELVEAWMKEPDGELAKAHSFRKENGEVVQLSGEAATIELIEKIEKGIESVVRFYPVVTRTRTYAGGVPACLENVGYIDTPPGPSATDPKKNGIAAVISTHQWLKVQDDAQEREGGCTDRIESWWGIAKTDQNQNEPWDPDLYGKNRWPMPYNHAG